MGRFPLISIVMPVYNAMPNLTKAVQSIFAQTIQDWQLTAIDDASIDGSWEYLKSIDDPRVAVYRNERNRKHPYCCNRAIALATAKYIAKMDADDLSLPTRLEKQAVELEKNPSIDVIGCGIYKVDNNLNLIGVRYAPSKHNEIVRLVRPGLEFFFGPNFWITDGALMGRREWFHRWKYDERIHYAQDFDLMCRAQLHSIFANVPEPLYIYRRGGDTDPLAKQTLAAFSKAKSLLRYGIRKGMACRTFAGLAATIPRPFFYAAIKMALATGYHKFKPIGREEHSAHRQLLAQALSEIANTIVPLKRV